MTAITVGGEIWTPPDGMEPQVRHEWAAFYRRAMTTYGVTPQQYRDLYVAQHGCCFVCRTAKGKNPDDPKGRGGRRLGVDHNHVTGRVRALLCSGSTSANTCNRLIGRYDLNALRRAVQVLEEEPAQTVLGLPAEPTFVADRDEFLRNVLELS